MGIIDDIFTLRRQNDFRSDGVWPTTVTAAAPSLPEATAGWITGGNQVPGGGAITTVQRITFATDTATSSTRGPLAADARFHAGVSNMTYGWVGGGYPANSRVMRITYTTDTSTASVRTYLSLSESGTGSVSDNTTYGWWGGGYVVLAPTYMSSAILRLTFATDTATTTTRGILSQTRYQLQAVSGLTDGWFAGGRAVTTFSPSSTLDRMTYSTDTATASVRGALNAAAYNHGMSYTSVYGFFVGGDLGSGNKQSRIQRVTYTNDTVQPTIRSATSGPVESNGGVGNSTYGWYAGGYEGVSGSPSQLEGTTNVLRYDYTSDTIGNRGSLTTGTQSHGDVSGIQ
jgi:hypothetical protein